MTIQLDETHDAKRRSWVESANTGDTDFPIQNLPFGVFSVGTGAKRGGVALGDRIIDLALLSDLGVLSPGGQAAARAASGETLAPLLAQPTETVSALRRDVSNLFRTDGAKDQARLQRALVATSSARLHLPVKPTAFTDFSTSYDHMRRMGGGAKPRLAALQLPVAYNGRASSIAVDGTSVIRPKGQFETPPGSGVVKYGPEPMLDFELELGVWLRGGNSLGQTISVADAEKMMFGCCLVNDWSARAIQFFESLLGPHLGKSFVTTISPWIVTMEALAPFRATARGRADDEPAIPAYLNDAWDRAQGAIRIALSADLALASGQSQRIVNTKFEGMYWTFAQMVAHQASTGAPLEAGDLVASGTASGPEDDARACFAELSQLGKVPVRFEGGAQRAMLEDGDTLTTRGRAHAPGHVPIGFGSCAGTITPALER